MSLDPLPLRLFFKIGTLKHQILIYGIIASVILMIFGKKSDPLLRTILMLGGMLMLFGAPAIWFVAHLKAPATEQEQVFRKNTIMIVNEHKAVMIQTILQKGDTDQC